MATIENNPRPETQEDTLSHLRAEILKDFPLKIERLKVACHTQKLPGRYEIAARKLSHFLREAESVRTQVEKKADQLLTLGGFTASGIYLMKSFPPGPIVEAVRSLYELGLKAKAFDLRSVRDPSALAGSRANRATFAGNLARSLQRTE